MQTTYKMNTPSAYRSQAREVLNNYWLKSALASLVYYVAILTPSAIVVILADGFNDPNTNSSLAWLGIFTGFGVMPITFGYCVAYLNHIRTKGTTFLKDTWHTGFQNYGRFLGAFMLVYLMSLVISGIISLASNVVEKYDSLLAFLIYIVVVLWLFYLLLQIMYAYRMVPYLIYDNPQLKVLDALKQSNKMMNGNKLLLFRIDISLFQWYIYAFILSLIFVVVGEYITSYFLLIIGGVLCIATILGTLLFLYPYICAISALFYEDLKAKSINKIAIDEALLEQNAEESATENNEIK